MHYSRQYRYGDVHHQPRRTRHHDKGPAVRKEYVVEYKLRHGCTDCGFNDHSAALQFDHLPGTSKVREIKTGGQLGWEALLEEIAKCEVVCANCHSIRTFNRGREALDATEFQPCAESE